MVTNAFGDKIPALWDIILDEELWPYIRDTLGRVVESLGVEHYSAQRFAKQVLGISSMYSSKALRSTNTNQYEEELSDLLSQTLKENGVDDVESRITESLYGRAQLIFEQIRPHLEGTSVLDYGCGDGRVASKIKKADFEIVCLDVYRHPNIGRNLYTSDAPFILLSDRQDMPDTIGNFDNALLLTVLHHTDDYLRNLLKAIKATKIGGKVIVIESVYGVSAEDKVPEPHEVAYMSLSSEQQRLVNIWFDHFYNRVVHYNHDSLKKVNVPYNFNTPQGWTRIFEQHASNQWDFVKLRQEHIVHLGIDQPLVPEYHTLHVLRKI